VEYRRVSRYLHPWELPDYVKRHTVRRYFVGWDLGQAQDFTAISVVERVKVPLLSPGWVPPKDEVKYDITYQVTYLDRLPLGTSYPDVVGHVRALLDTAPLSGNSTLVVDYSGVGRPVYDLLLRARLAPVGITITSGDGWSRDGAVYRVSKKILVSTIDAKASNGQLFVAPLLNNAEILKSELLDLRRKFTDSGYAQFEARSGRHDDLVLSVAVALWHASMHEGSYIGVGRVYW
jgi:hypothetical protein